MDDQASLSSGRCVEDDLELPDLELVAADQLSYIDTLPVHVGTIQASGVLDDEGVAFPRDLRVAARHRDVVQEHVAVGAPAESDDVLVDEHRAARRWAALDDEQRLVRAELF